MEKPFGVILADGPTIGPHSVEKSQMMLGGETLLARALRRLGAQCSAVAVSGNAPADTYKCPDIPVLPDARDDRPGPMAGILAGLDWAAQNGASSLVTLPVDMPHAPDTLVETLIRGAGARGFAIAATAGKTFPMSDDVIRQPLVGVWPVALRAPLREALARDHRKVNPFARAHNVIVVEFPCPNGIDPFFNIATPDDLNAAQRKST